MREIKFRAWCRRTQTMISDGSIDMAGHLCLWYGEALEPDCEPDAVLMQYTGLKDRNGVEIYEGDIIRSEVLGCVKVCPVQWQGSGFWMADYIDGEGVWHGGWWANEQYMEVVGNIHENPDLLDG